MISNWETYRVALFKRIMEIIGRPSNVYNSFTYEILGYNFLDTKLILHFQDCNEVWEFSYDQENQSINEIKFFNKDFEGNEYIDQIKRFETAYKLDIPEVITSNEA